MVHQVVADLIVVAHLGFIAFVVAGGFLALRWRWVSLVHLPSAVWGALIEFQGWICPLTPLEQRLRHGAGEAGYTGSFVEYYIVPIVYPYALTRGAQIAIGVFVVAVNLSIYGALLYRMGRGR